jgi:hypothetical protein
MLYIVKAYFGDYYGNWNKTIYSTSNKEDAEYIVSILNPTYKKCAQLHQQITDEISDLCYLKNLKDRDYYWEALYRLQEKLKEFDHFQSLDIKEIKIGKFNPLVM